MTSILLFLLVVIAATIAAEERLVKVVCLNRHGHRAPNEPYWQICPNAQRTRRHYENPEDLTGLGAAEEYKAGQVIRQRYRNLYGENYDYHKIYAQAVGEPRTIQSAEIVLRGMFDRKGPVNEFQLHHQTVPVFSNKLESEHLIDSALCWTKIGKDKAQYFATRGKETVAQPQIQKLLGDVFRACNSTPFDTFNAALVQPYVKVVNDGLIFDFDEGLTPLSPKLWARPEKYYEFRNLSTFLLLQSLLGTPSQVTAVAGDLPLRMVHTFLAAAEAPPPGKMWMSAMAEKASFDLYVMHREEMYAMMLFYGIDVKLKGIPPTEIPTGTNVFYELWLNEENGEKEYSIVQTMTSMRDGDLLLKVPSCKNPARCTLREFVNIFKQRMEETGDWSTICQGKPEDTWKNVNY